MDKIISKLFSDYLFEQNIATNAEYSALSKSALQKEKDVISFSGISKHMFRACDI